jgi:hypothetical protein
VYSQRGKQVHDIDALADALVRLSRLVTDDAERIHDVEVNPLSG